MADDVNEDEDLRPESQRPIRAGLIYLGLLLTAVMLILLYTAGLV